MFCQFVGAFGWLLTSTRDGGCYLASETRNLGSGAQYFTSQFLSQPWSVFPHTSHQPWASYQIRKTGRCACAGNAWNVFPDMHHGTCVTRVPWCMPISLTSDFLWSRWRGKRSLHPSVCTTHNFTYLVRGPWMCFSKCVGTFGWLITSTLDDECFSFGNVRFIHGVQYHTHQFGSLP